MKSLTREEQGSLEKNKALCLCLYVFCEAMFKTSKAKRGTSVSGESGLNLLSVVEVKFKEKAIASTQHFPFPHKIKDGPKSGPKRRNR